MKAKLFSLVALALLALASCAQAQYIGNVGLQTDQETLAAAGTKCTGISQTFTPHNFGQGSHFASMITSGAVQGTMEIDGLDTAGNSYRISDVWHLTGSTFTGVGSVAGSGYFGKIQVAVTCSPTTASFTLTYTGSQTPFEPTAGTYLLAQVDKVSFAGISASSSQNDTYQTPFGNAAGTIYFAYSSSSQSGSSLTVACIGSTVGNTWATTFPLANTTSLQSFPVSPVPCPVVSIGYAHGGSGGTIYMEYLYNLPGTLSPSGLAATPFHSGAVTTASGVKSSAGNLYGYHVYNPNASACYLEFFNTSSITLGSTTPVFAFGIAATTDAYIAPGSMALSYFSSVIYIAAVTADGGSTTCSTGLSVNLWYQ